MPYSTIPKKQRRIYTKLKRPFHFKIRNSNFEPITIGAQIGNKQRLRFIILNLVVEYFINFGIPMLLNPVKVT